MNYKKNISAFNLLISSISLILLGLFILFYTRNFLNWFPYITGIILIYTALSKFYSFYIKKLNEKKILILIADTAILIQGIIAFISPKIILFIFPGFVLFYSTVLGIIYLISYFQNKKTHTPHSTILLIKSIFFFTISILVITMNFYYKTFIITKLVGLYLIFYGITIFTDFIDEEIPKSYANKMIRKISIRLPVLFTMGILKKTLTKITNYLNSGENKNDSIYKKTDLEPNLEVLIHVKETGAGIFGHMDIYYKGFVISYGNYDYATYRLFDSIGEGVIFFIKGKEDYIKFCNKYHEKTIFDFGLNLTDEQMKKVEEKINEHIRNSYPWLSPKDFYKNSKKKFDDYASQLARETNIKFRKIKRGRFKNYFTFYTNCVKFADTILGQTGIDILNLNGILSPGSYYNYFEREYKRNNSIVITKTAYHSKGIVK